MILIFTCHSILHTFMIDIIREIGGNESSQGTAVMIQALLELIPMMMIGRIMKKIPVESLMIFSAIFYSVKHLVVFLAGNMGVFYFGLVFQIVSYGVIIPASVYLANKYIAPEDLNQGQAVMTATVSAGGILASYSGGALINAFSAHTALLFGVILSVTGTILMIFGISRLKQTAGRPV
jgi:PPP family 3-phenylpropionic acid transporter